MALMVSKSATKMDQAVQGVFIHLPIFLQTKEVEEEIAKCVARSTGDFDEAALEAAIAVFDRYQDELESAKLARLKR